MTSAVEREGARPGGVFVGREYELAELDAGLDEAEGGRGSLFLLVGEPGIGKSRLADELAARARERGFLVLWGRCWEAGGAPAYWPWVQSLRAHVRATDPQDLAEQLGAGAGHVAQIIPDVRAVLSDVDMPDVGDPDAARFQLFDAATSFLLAVSQRQPILLVLDDLHVADTPSLLLLRFASGELVRGRILVVGSYRDPDPDHDGPLPPELVELGREPITRSLLLAGLSEPDVTRFIDRTTGIAPSAPLVLAVFEQTEGNPLFLGELVRLLAQEGGLTSVAPGARLTIPRSVGEVIGRRLAHLSSVCREALETASVIGREFDLGLVAHLVGRPDPEILARLDEASWARVVGEVPVSPGRFRFSHALIRDVLYEGIPASLRIDLHRRTGEALESLPEEEQTSRLAELAHHFHLSTPGGGTERGVAYARKAGDDAAVRLAYEEAARLYEMALQQVKFVEGSPGEQKCELLLRLGDARWRAGDLAAARETLADAANLAKRLGDAGRLARAAISYAGEVPWIRAGGDRRMIPLLEDALHAIGDRPDPWRVRLLARLACALRGSRDREQSEILGRQAVEMARELGDPPTLLYALVGLCGAIWWPENPEERLTIADEIIERAHAVADPERAYEGHLVREFCYLELGDMSRFQTEYAYLATPLEEVRFLTKHWTFTVLRANLALQQGRLADVERLASEARDDDLGARSMLSEAHTHFASHTYFIRTEQGRPREALELVQDAAGRFTWYPFLRCELADLLLQLDDDRASMNLYAELAADRFGSVARDNEWLFALTLLAPLSVRHDDLEGAAILYELLLPFADRHAVGHSEGTTGSVSRALGILAAGLSRIDNAEKHFAFAIEHNGRMGARLWTADTQVRFARMLLTRDAPGDRERAEMLLSDALRTSKSLNLVRIEAEIRELRPGIQDSQAVVLPPTSATFRREGEYWSMAFDGDAFRLKDSKGLRYLSVLLAAPGREIHALELVSAVQGHAPGRTPCHAELRPETGDGAKILDERAKGEYAHRIGELESELAVAEEWNDPERASRLRMEIDFISNELGAAVGLGGRDRAAATNAERARVNVTRAIKAALVRIAEHSPSLGRHLGATIRTGTFCMYEPDPRVPVSWSR